ncbi:MAG: PAS domain S-box protein [Pseudomonadota bacterium]
MTEAELQRRIAQLEQELEESQQLVRALTGGEIDTLLNETHSTPVLLHAAQERLRANEQMLRAVFDGAMDAMLVVDDQGRFIDANPAACAVFGLAKEALIGLDSTAFAGPSHDAGSTRRTLLGEGRLSGDVSIARADGVQRDLEYSAVANVLPGVHLSVFQDVTERKASEAALREAEQRLRTVIATAPIILFAIDAQGVYTLHEGKGVEGLGLRPGELVGVSAIAGRGAELTGRDVAIKRALAGEQVYGTFAGAGKTFDCTVMPARDASGAITGVNGVAIDVTSRQTAEAALRASEARYRRIVENTSEGVWMYDVSGITTFMNARMAQMLGWTVGDAIGQPIFRFMDEAAGVQARARVARRAAGEAERGEFKLERRDGSVLWVTLHADPLFDRNGQYEGSLALVTDATDYRRGEEARNRLAAIVESSHDAIIGNDLNGVITSWNKAAETLYQWSAQEVIGQPISILAPPGAERDELDILARIQSGEVLEHYDASRIRRDGSVVEVAVGVSAIRNAVGEIIGFSKIARDLTERRKAEATLRHIEEQLRQGQKMEAIGKLAGGIAHDFNNLLSIILTYTELMISEIKPADPLIADLEHVKKAGERAARLTKQLLAFSRQQILEPQVLDLNQATAGIREMLGRVLGEQIRLSVLEGANLGRIFADPGQIEQILMNLVVNARDAIGDVGAVTIETSNVDLDETYGDQHQGMTAGSYVMLAVTDTGTGMDATTAKRIFDPFFTTKEKGKGTGLGLATVHGIVHQSGGHIWVYSEVGHGTTFKVYFPRTNRVELARAPHSQPPRSLDGTETILLVEDEEAVRISVRTILKKQGYNVLEAADGEEGLLLCQAYRAQIDLLLTDVVMPRMTGRTLADRVSVLRPEVKVLYMSGYTENTIVHHGVLDAGIAYLPKPITPIALAKKVREVLDAPRQAAAVCGPS